MAYASGKYAQFISDRSGVAFPYREMRIEWNGSRVAASEFEEKQPQLDIAKNIVDPEALKNASTDRVEPAVEVLLKRNAFKSGSAGSAVITVQMQVMVEVLAIAFVSEMLFVLMAFQQAQ